MTATRAEPPFKLSEHELDVARRGVDAMTPLDFARAARFDYLLAGDRETCPVCRESWLLAAAVGDHLVYTAELSDHLARHEHLKQVTLWLTQIGDRVALWSFLGKLVSRIRRP